MNLRLPFLLGFLPLLPLLWKPYLENLEYADDLAVIAETEQYLIKRLNNWEG